MIRKFFEKLKTNWVMVALFLWILWATASLKNIERDTDHISGQVSVVSRQVEEKASSAEVEDVKSEVENVKSEVDDLETTIQNLER